MEKKLVKKLVVFSEQLSLNQIMCYTINISVCKTPFINFQMHIP